jgi:hypothetical protein
MNYQIEKTDINDAEEILKIQKLAYQIEARRYNNYDIAPLKQTREKIKVRYYENILFYFDRQ